MEDSVIHVLLLPYPSQGHINPMLQFSKRIFSKSKGKVKPTLLLTHFIFNSNPISDLDGVRLDAISDGYDQGGFAQAPDIHTYLTTLQEAGSRSLSQLISNYNNNSSSSNSNNSSSSNSISCLVYDSFLPWALDVAKHFGLLAASFFTQPCAVNYIYYNTYHRILTLPPPSLPVSIPGMPLLQLQDMPSYIYVHGSYPAYFQLVLNQFFNLNKADFVFVNTFYKLEDEVVDAMSKLSPMMTIGPTIPSFYLDDNQLEDNDNKDYGLHLYNLNDSSAVCNEWLNSKPTGSVIYVSFGSMACLAVDQMEEIARGLRGICNDYDYYYLWVVRDTEEKKLSEKFKQETSDSKGLIVSWSLQLQVLSNKTVGCFFSHGGWNSTIEALSLGVPMVVMPQWTDQTTNAKFVQDVWKVGIRVKVDEISGIVGRQEIKNCIKKVMEGEDGIEMKKNAVKWSELAKEAVREGGTSDNNIKQFLSKLTDTLLLSSIS